MASVEFTANLSRQTTAAAAQVAGATLSAVLEELFVQQPNLRSYVLDDQGAVRPHVVIFLDGQPIADRCRLSDAVRKDSKVFIMQALSGG